MDKLELEKKVANNPVVQELMLTFKECPYDNIFLIGGAIVDLIENREPKDYDIMGVSDSQVKHLLKAGYEFQYDSRTSKTFKKGKVVVQLIKATLEQFDFKISQSRYNLSSRKASTRLIIDEISLNNKILIPVRWDDKINAINALKRIPHWKKKGYDIHEKTYLSLLGVVTNSRDIKS